MFCFFVQEWDTELKLLKTLKEGDDDYDDMAEKLSALYGEKWKGKNLQEGEHFRNILKLLQSKRKYLKCDTVRSETSFLSLQRLTFTQFTGSVINKNWTTYCNLEKSSLKQS